MSKYTRYTGGRTTLSSYIQASTDAEMAPPKREFLLVDSRDRDVTKHADPGDYIVQLPETLHQVSAISLIMAEIPSSFYVFTQERQNVVLPLTYQGLTYPVTIPDGNYGFSSMVTVLADAINSRLGTDTAYEPFSVEIQPQTFHIIIKGPVLVQGGAREDFAVSLTAPDRVWPLGYYLGLGRNVTLNASNGVIEGAHVCSLNPELYICLDIQNHTNANTILEPGIEGEGGTMGKCMAKIPLDVDSFQYVFFDRPVVENVVLPPIPTLTALHIHFRFHDGTPINFNGVNHSLTFEIQCSSTRV